MNACITVYLDPVPGQGGPASQRFFSPGQKYLGVIAMHYLYNISLFPSPPFFLYIFGVVTEVSLTPDMHAKLAKYMLLEQKC